MIKKFGNIIKNFDSYGYRVNLNFKKQGEIVRIYIGGAISLLVILLNLAFAGLKLYIMFSKTNSTVSSLESTLSLEEFS